MWNPFSNLFWICSNFLEKFTQNAFLSEIVNGDFHASFRIFIQNFVILFEASFVEFRSTLFDMTLQSRCRKIVVVHQNDYFFLYFFIIIDFQLFELNNSQNTCVSSFSVILLHNLNAFSYCCLLIKIHVKLLISNPRSN